MTGPLPEDRHRRLRAIFDEAALKEMSERDSDLDQACTGDAELRAHVMRLLAVDGQPGSFLDRPVEAWLAGRDDVPFTGTDRFRILRQVGTGGMGIVYEVHDTLRDEAVALKTLHRTSATDLYRLEREFRSLVDITHPSTGTSRWRCTASKTRSIDSSAPRCSGTLP